MLLSRTLGLRKRDEIVSKARVRLLLLYIKERICFPDIETVDQNLPAELSLADECEACGCHPSELVLEDGTKERERMSRATTFDGRKIDICRQCCFSIFIFFDHEVLVGRELIAHGENDGYRRFTNPHRRAELRRGHWSLHRRRRPPKNQTK